MVTLWRTVLAGQSGDRNPARPEGAPFDSPELDLRSVFTFARGRCSRCARNGAPSSDRRCGGSFQSAPASSHPGPDANRPASSCESHQDRDHSALLTKSYPGEGKAPSAASRPASVVMSGHHLSHSRAGCRADLRTPKPQPGVASKVRAASRRPLHLRPKAVRQSLDPCPLLAPNTSAVLPLIPRSMVLLLMLALFVFGRSSGGSGSAAELHPYFLSSSSSLTMRRPFSRPSASMWSSVVCAAHRPGIPGGLHERHIRPPGLMAEQEKCSMGSKLR